MLVFNAVLSGYAFQKEPQLQQLLLVHASLNFFGLQFHTVGRLLVLLVVIDAPHAVFARKVIYSLCQIIHSDTSDEPQTGFDNAIIQTPNGVVKRGAKK